MKVNFKKLTGRQWATNLVLYAIGVVLMPLGVVFTINAHLGANGYDALNFVLADLLHINTSIAVYSTAFIALMLAALLRRSIPRFTTFISSLFLGFFTDVWQRVFAGVQGTTLPVQILMMILGLVIIALAVASYAICIFPTNPTDDLVLALTEKGWRLGIAKIVFDVVCVIISFLLGGEIGLATIVITFGLGTLVDLFHTGIQKLLKVWGLTLS